MKKIIMILMVGAVLLTAVSVQADSVKNRGGVMGFIAGCCFGVRAGGDYNSGKEVHWREWCGLIPVVSIVMALWNGIDGANGVTRAQYAERYGSVYY